MSKRILSLLGFLVFFFIIWPDSCYSQSSASFHLKRWSISNGGSVVHSSNFILKESAIGGFGVGESLSNSYALNGGMLITTVEDSNLARSLLPKMFLLQQNYPNPFNPTTTIQYTLPKRTEVTIQIFNPLGQMVRTFDETLQQPGSYQVIWDGKDSQGHQVPSGFYFYRIIADGFTDVRKMILLK